MSVDVFLRIKTGVILIGDAILANQCLGVRLEIGLCENELFEFHEFYIARMRMRAN